MQPVRFPGVTPHVVFRFARKTANARLPGNDGIKKPWNGEEHMTRKSRFQINQLRFMKITGYLLQESFQIVLKTFVSEERLFHGM